MEPFATDRNLLFGILALQMDFISRDALISAINAWALEKYKPLGQVLEEQGALAPADRALLEPLVQRHIEQHGNDPSQSLASLSSVEWIRGSLEPLGQIHPEIVPSLQRLSSPESTAPAEPRAKAAPSEATGPAGSRFRILRFHARGGLGDVFVASDDELHREVALKQIQDRHSGHLEGRIRFVREAEITGGLEHPGIVPVYGLGHYDDGRPFYAMRFIKGDSLRQAIDQFHSKAVSGLNPGERMLELQKLLRRFLDVCNAIAYAHSRGVLHRDIKPGNIMVGPYGETLVVDWGLAKVVGRSESSAEVTLRPPSASGSSETLTGSPIGTPSFMSPEQAAGSIDQLGPASDVYSLGATLYCLLTGKAPIEGAEVEEVLRRVQQGEIPPPRQVEPDVPRALEAICLKAMALKPKDRYPAPRALAEDIERWLADEPVSAWREPYSIRGRRWMRRNRTVVTTAAATVLVGLCALGFAYWRESAFNVRLTTANLQLDDANRQVIAQNEQLETTNAKLVEANDQVTRAKVESDHRLDQTLQANEDYYTGVSEEVLLNQKEFRVLRTRLLEKPRQFYEKLAAELETVSPQDVRAQTLLARGRSNLGHILQISGRHDEARKQYEAAKELYTILDRAQPGNPGHLKGLFSSSGNLSIVLAYTGQNQAASEVAQKAIDIVSKLVKDDPENPILQNELARHDQILAKVLSLLGKTDRSIGLLREAIVIRTKMTASSPDNPEYAGLLAHNHAMLGQQLRTIGDLGGAGKSLRQSIDILTRLLAAHPDRLDDRISMASTYNDLGNVLLDQRNLNGAIESFQKAIAIGEKLAAEHPNHLDYSYHAALGYDNLCRALYTRRDNLGARNAARAALSIWSRLTTEDPTATEYQRGLADQYSRLGLALLQIGSWTESKEAFQKAIDLQTKLVASHPDVPDYQNRLAANWGNLGLLAAQTQDYQTAADGFQRASQINEKLVSAHPNLLEYRTSLGISTYLLGKVQIALGQREKAILSLRRAIDHQQAALSRAPLNAMVKRRLSVGYLDLGETLATLGRAAEAIETIRKRRALGMENSIDIYNDACQLARCVPIERDTPAREAVAAEAVTTLRAAIAAGWNNALHTSRDPDLAPLRDRDDFRRLVAELFDRSFPADPFAR